MTDPILAVLKEFGVSDEWISAYVSAKFSVSPLQLMAEEILRLVAENEKMKEAWMCDQTNITTQLAHSERRREKLMEALLHVVGNYPASGCPQCTDSSLNKSLILSHVEDVACQAIIAADAAEDV